MMCCRHQKICDKVFLNRLHALDASAAAVLRLKVIDGHSLDITKVRHGDDRIPVSYTHLDVYKRQVDQQLTQCNYVKILHGIFPFLSFLSVSYTHLDVYKRQSSGSPIRVFTT